MKSTEGVPPLRRRFIVPPFSSLHVQADYWTVNNQKWKDIGLIFHPRPENFVLDTGELETFEPNCNTLLGHHIRVRAHMKAFRIVPTTLWSARGGYWLKLKKFWIHQVGIRGERGREESAKAYNISPNQLPRDIESIPALVG